MDNFVPRHVTQKSIELLEKCKCIQCQTEKRKLEEKLSNNKNSNLDKKDYSLKDLEEMKVMEGPQKRLIESYIGDITN